MNNLEVMGKKKLKLYVPINTVPLGKLSEQVQCTLIHLYTCASTSYQW